MENRILVTGGSGQVATGLFEIMLSRGYDLSKVYAMDLVPMKTDFSQYGLNYVENSYLYYLDDFMLENKITTIVHLIPESSLPIWNACEKLPWRVNYVDASVYISAYSSNLDYSHLLLSNFKKFDRVRTQYSNIRGLSSSGFNPGVVNFLFDQAIKEYGTKGLKAAYVIEHDSYRFLGEEDPNKIYVTWGGEACPSECAEPPIWFKNGNPITIKEKACDTPFKFKMGGKEYQGMAVIHEECYQLAKKYDIETTFLYSLPETTVAKIKEYGDKYDSEDVVVMSPLVHQMEGSDQLGIKLVYDHYEVNITNTNTGTDLVSGVTRQVAVGVFSALHAFLNSNMDKGLQWIDEYFNDANFLYIYEDTLYSLLDFETEEVPYSDGLLKNRASIEYKEILLAPKFDKVNEIDEEAKKWSFFDYYWADFVYSLEDEYTSTELDTLYTQVYEHFEHTLFDTFDEGMETIKSYIEELASDGIEAPHLVEGLNLVWIEEVLICEGCLQNNIHSFIYENLEELITLAKEDPDEVYFNAVKLYEFGGYYDYVR